MPATLLSLFFFNDTATTEIYTLSLHDALPIFRKVRLRRGPLSLTGRRVPLDGLAAGERDRKRTRLNYSHQIISYAVFCLKKKRKNQAPKNALHEHSRMTDGQHD